MTYHINDPYVGKLIYKLHTSYLIIIRFEDATRWMTWLEKPMKDATISDMPWRGECSL